MTGRLLSKLLASFQRGVRAMTATMDMPEEWLIALRKWAHDNGNVRELWLFGSRASRSVRPDSDVDLAIALMPAADTHDWALGNFAALNGKWALQLASIVGRDVSLEAILPGTEPNAKVRQSGKLLWARASSP
jgi:predicted nucleotidyltransferase